MPKYKRATDVLRQHVELEHKLVIDVGSGDGGLVRWLRKQGAHPVGVECGRAILAQARAADPDNADDYLEGVGQDLPLEDSTAGVVILFRSLHHIPADRMLQAMVEAHRVLEPDGSLFVLEPAYDEQGGELQSLIDDETTVRAQAQAVLLNVPELGFELVASGGFIQEVVYQDFAHWEKHMIDVDPLRLAALDQNRARAKDLFYQVGAHIEDGGLSFDHPDLFQVFRKLAL